MKTKTNRQIVLLLILCGSIPCLSQSQLLDSLKGTWILKEQYNNGIRVVPKGTIEFEEDGVFKSAGSYFGSTEGLYRTDETKSTIHIDIDGKTSEWTAIITNHVLRMTRPRKKRAPRVELVFFSDKAENNSSGT